MPTPRRPLASARAKRLIDRTPAERAKVAIERLEHVLGDRSRVKLKVDVVISRASAERLMAQALEQSETMTFALLLASILERARRNWTGRRRRRRGARAPAHPDTLRASFDHSICADQHCGRDC